MCHNDAIGSRLGPPNRVSFNNSTYENENFYFLLPSHRMNEIRHTF